MSNEVDRYGHLEARVEALSTTLKTVLTTLVMRGILTRADVAAILRDSEAVLAEKTPKGLEEMAAVREDLPKYLRTAMGPPPDDDEHGGH